MMMTAPRLDAGMGLVGEQKPCSVLASLCRPHGVPGGMGQFPRASRQPEAHASGNHFPALCLL